LVELHGGTIDAESDGRDRGARFVIRLPVAAVAPTTGTTRRAGEAATPSRAEATSAPWRPGTGLERPSELSGKKVLVVDDDEDARRLVATVLAGCGCDVTTAASVAEAMARFDDERFDVLVSDIGMPNEDGLALIERIRARPADRGGR